MCTLAKTRLHLGDLLRTANRMHQAGKNDSACQPAWFSQDRALVHQPVRSFHHIQASQIHLCNALDAIRPAEVPGTSQVFLRWLIAVGFDSSNNYVRQLTLFTRSNRRRPPPRRTTRPELAASSFFQKYGTCFCLFVFTVQQSARGTSLSLRAEEAAPLQSGVSPEDWASRLLHFFQEMRIRPPVTVEVPPGPGSGPPRNARKEISCFISWNVR